MPPSPFRQRDGLKIRREILARIKTQVQLYLGDEPRAIRSYALAYKKDIERTRWTESTSAEFLSALSQAEVVFAGDFHAFAQAQRVHLRNLRSLSQKQRVILAVECVASRHQKALDQYMAGQIDESSFLKKVRWEKNWGFAWAQYRPLFEWVRAQGGRCLALNEPSLKRTMSALHRRDRHAVKILAQAYRQLKEGEAIYTVYGDLHIAQERLPALFQKAIKAKKPRVLTVYLNPEKIYFQLFKKNLEHKVNVIRFSKNEFCLLESPPWVKWQSYLLFLEETVDESLFDEDGAPDYSHHVHSLFKMMASDLGQDLSLDTTVYSFNDHDFLDLLSERMAKRDFGMVEQFVQNDIGFYEPRRDVAFLPRGTVNYAAHLAGLIFHSKVSGRQDFIFEFPQDFIQSIWFEAVAFFLSKLVNPHRKASSLGDIKKQLAAFSPGDGGEEALKLALDQKMRDLQMVYGGSQHEPPPRRARPQMPLNYYKAAKLLGAMMGERIHAVFKTGRLSRSKALVWLKEPLGGKNSQDFYIQILKELDTMEAGDGYG